MSRLPAGIAEAFDGPSASRSVFGRAASAAGGASPLPAGLPLAAWVAVVLASLVAFGDTWVEMVEVWAGSDKFQHGFAIAPIAAWAAWRVRDRLAGLTQAPSPAGAAASLACCALWAVGSLAGVNAAMQLAAVGLVGALAWALLGTATAAAIAFPLGYLLFMVPLGEGLAGPLTTMTADVLEAALRGLGVPLVREAFEFTLPTGRWSVVEACGGLNYLVASLPLATVLAWTRFAGLGRRAAFVGLALALAVVSNWLRAIVVVMVGHLSSMRYGTGLDHVVYGWVMFGAVMLGVSWLATRLGDDPVPQAPSDGRVMGCVQRRPPGGAIAPLLAAATALLVAIAGAVHVGAAATRIVPRDGFEARVAAALAEPGRREPGVAAMVPEPRYAGARSSVALRVDPQAGIDVFAAYYAGQRQGSELIGWGNTVLARSDRRWRIFEESVQRVGPLGVVEYLVRDGDRRRIIWHWTVADGAPREGPAATKLASLAGLLRGRGDHAAVGVLSADLDSLGPQAARDRLAPWAVRLAGALDAHTGPATER
jgi:exosortase A